MVQHCNNATMVQWYSILIKGDDFRYHRQRPWQLSSTRANLAIRSEKQLSTTHIVSATQPVKEETAVLAVKKSNNSPVLVYLIAFLAI